MAVLPMMVRWVGLVADEGRMVVLSSGSMRREVMMMWGMW